MATTPKLIERRIRVKTYRPVKGDALVEAMVTVIAARPLDDPFFATIAKRLARGRGKVVEWRVY